MERTDRDMLIRHDQKLSSICATLQRIEEKLDIMTNSWNSRVQDCLVKFEQRPTFEDLEKEKISSRPTRKEIYGTISLLCACLGALLTLLHYL